MRIISGEWGGRSIPGRPNPKLRPTSEKVREAIFDQLEAKWVSDWSSLRILDIFAGLGTFGIESLSRGAQKAVFVDHHLLTARQLQEAIKELGAESRAEIFCKGALDAVRWLHQREYVFDIIFMDPPYREGWVVAMMNQLLDYPLLKREGILIAEYDKRETLSTTEALWNQLSAKKYGDTLITFLTPKEM